MPKFEKEFADSGAMVWLEDAKISILTGSINVAMRTALVYRGTPATFVDLILLLRRIDTDLDLLSTGTRRGANEDERWSNRSQSPATDQMDWTPTRTNRVRTNNIPQKRVKWVEKDELDRRREEGLCYCCGREGCRTFTCPLLLAIRPVSRLRTANSATGKS